ncbi:MAG: hypothetical protein J6Y07_02925 [Alphaproteobacteria bacterium]|nr:hypothetical protein [Alphaproteobacteria bacterium]
MLKTKKQLQEMPANEVVDYLLKHHKWYRLKARCESGFPEYRGSKYGWNTFIIAGHALYGANWYNTITQRVCVDNPELTLIKYNGKKLPKHLPNRWEMTQDMKNYCKSVDGSKLVALYSKLDWRAFATPGDKFDSLPDWVQTLIILGCFITYFTVAFFCSRQSHKDKDLNKPTTVLEQKKGTNSAPCNTADFYRFKNELQH